MVMAQIPRVHSRLNTFKVKFEAQLLLVEAATVLRHHLQAQTELKASTCFAAVLEEALAHGVWIPYRRSLQGHTTSCCRSSTTRRPIAGRTGILGTNYHCCVCPSCVVFGFCTQDCYEVVLDLECTWCQ